MSRAIRVVLVTAFSATLYCQGLSAQPAEKAWIDKSNAYTNQLLSIEFEHDPERGSRQGLAKFDERVSQPTLADQLAERHELQAGLAKVDAAGSKESDERVREDIDILNKAFDLRF